MRFFLFLILFFILGCFAESKGPEYRDLSESEKSQISLTVSFWNDVEELPQANIDFNNLKISILQEEDFKVYCGHCGPGRCISGECNTCAVGCLELNYSYPTIIQHVDTKENRVYCKIVIHETLHYLEYKFLGKIEIDYNHESSLVWRGPDSLINNIPIQDCR